MFNAKFNGIDVFDEETLFEGRRIPRSGISYSQELEWVFAAWADGKGLDEFAAKAGEYQSAIVAAYRAKQQIDAVLAEDMRIKLKHAEVEAEARRQSGYR